VIMDTAELEEWERAVLIILTAMSAWPAGETVDIPMRQPVESLECSMSIAIRTMTANKTKLVGLQLLWNNRKEDENAFPSTVFLQALLSIWASKEHQTLWI
jgi:hypothetical protein